MLCATSLQAVHPWLALNNWLGLPVAFSFCRSATQPFAKSIGPSVVGVAVGDGSSLDSVIVGVGAGVGGSADDEDESPQPDSHNRQQDIATSRRFTTSNPPEIRGDRRRDVSGTGTPAGAASRRLWTT